MRPESDHAVHVCLAACRSESAASGSDASAITALGEGSSASPGHRSSSSQSRDSTLQHPWKASGSSSLPFEDIFESPAGLAGTPPDSSSRPSSRNTDSSGVDAPFLSAPHIEQSGADAAEPSTPAAAEESASQHLEQSTALAAEFSTPAPTAEAADRGDKGHVGAEVGASAAASGAAQERREQFSLEILRCRAVCPDWQDSSPAPGRPHWQRQHALTLSVPQLLLQLPPTEPAQHPLVHPVEVHSFDSASPKCSASRDGSNTARGGHATHCSKQQSHESIARDGTVVSAVHLAFHVEVFDPGKAPQAGHSSSPFISIPDVSATYQGLQPAPEVSSETPTSSPILVPCTKVHIASILMDVAPGRLATLLAAVDWGKSELAHILGQADKQAPHMRRAKSLPVLSRLLRLSPGMVSGTVETLIARMRGVSHLQPTLQLDMAGLGLDAVRLPDEAAVGLHLQLPQLKLALTGLPQSSSDNQATAGPENQSSRALQSPKSFGRSASAPSPPLRRAVTAASNVEV